MIFDWDEEKAKINLRKHKVSFQETSTAFGDPLSETFNDPDHSENEFRFIIIGHSINDRLPFVSHTDDGKRVRIISARETTKAERKQYEQEFR